MSGRGLPIAGALALALAVTACREPNAPAAAPPASDAPTPAKSAGQASASGAPLRPVASTPPDAKLEPARLCNLEFLDGAPFGAADASVAAPFRLRGWLGDASGARPEAPVLVLASADGPQATVPVQLDIERPDVVAAFGGQASLHRSGFEVQVDPSLLAAGRWHAYLRFAVGGRNFVCDNGRYLRITAR